MKHILTVAIAAASLSFVACDDATSADDAARVTLGFSTTSGAAMSAVTAGSSPVSIAAGMDQLVITGSNGTLTITDIAFIVDEFKLERDGAPCDDIEGEDEDDDCETFETGLAFVDLPLTGATEPVVTQTVPAGTYVFLKLETDDVDVDEADDQEEIAEIDALMNAIEAAGFAEWPEDASLVVVGTFVPTGGTPRPFTAFFEGEIKIEMPFDPALVIDGESGIVDIEIAPSLWYTNLDGTVADLSAFDFATTGEVVEFEAKMADGFTKIELEGFND